LLDPKLRFWVRCLLGLAWLGFVCTGAASDATVRDKKNSLTGEKKKHEVTRNTIGCVPSDDGESTRGDTSSRRSLIQR